MIKSRPPIILWLGLPLIFLGILLSGRLWDGGSLWSTWFGGEMGLVELATVGLLLPAIVMGGFCARYAAARSGDHARLMTIYWTLFVFGVLFFAGEEASWGQHWIGWETPESIARWNDQAETNLHNTSSWLDQKPRAALELWVIASLVWSLYRIFMGVRFDAGRLTHWALGGPRSAVAALTAEVVRVPERLAGPGEPLPQLINVRLAEVQELFFAIFILVVVTTRIYRYRSVKADT